MQKNELIQAYRVYLLTERYLKHDTVTNKVYEISIFLLWTVNFGYFLALDSVDFNKYLEFRYSNKQYTRTYTNKIIQCLQDFYEWMHATGRIKNNPAILLEKASAEQKLPTFLRMDEVFRIENCFADSETGKRDAAFIETLLSSGLRVSECLNLNLRDLETEAPKAMGKGGVERIVIINDAAREKIKKYLQVRNIESEFLFCNNQGKRLSRSYIDKMIKAIALKAGITKKLSAHKFRHTFASLLYEGGLNLIEIRDLMAHKTVQTTEIYTRTNITHLRDVIARCHPRS